MGDEKVEIEQMDVNNLTFDPCLVCASKTKGLHFQVIHNILFLSYSIFRFLPAEHVPHSSAEQQKPNKFFDVNEEPKIVI
jgi:hypothetical protein